MVLLSLKFSALILYIFKINLCLGKFEDEYPNVKVCLSNLGNDYGFVDSEVIIRNINDLNKNNCTHILGSIYIKGLKGKDGTKVSLDKIQEINGDVVIEHNEITSISFKSLRVIRGYSKRTEKLNNKFYNFSLMVFLNLKLEEVDLRSLRAIPNHNVYIDDNPVLKYLPHQIDWKQLFSNNAIQKFIKFNSSTEIKVYGCSSTCESKENKVYCWGPAEEQCQKAILCNQQLECSSCYHRPDKIAMCCSDQCLGGCSGSGSSKCYACKSNKNGAKCTDGCPHLYKGSAVGTILNEDFKYQVASFCSKSCPARMLPETLRCVYTCSKGYFENENKKCVECHGGNCNLQTCNILNIEESLGSKYGHILHKSVLSKFINCSKLEGYLGISEKSFRDFGVTVQMLYDNLKNVEYIEGGFMYFRDNHLTNLTFLQNLKSFKARNLNSEEQNLIHLSNKFDVFGTSLEFLGLKNLKSVEGRFRVSSNKNLCFLDLPWKEIVKTTEKPSIGPGKNCTDKKCDKECSEKSCWGPGNKLCYTCRNFDANGTCVSNCTEIRGYFLSNVNKANLTCSRCHIECANTCSNASNSGCIGGCLNKEENGVCVKTCSSRFYIDGNSNKCFPCHEDCKNNLNISCTGPLRSPGPDGCKKCNLILLDGNDQIQHCVKKCPQQTFSFTLVQKHSKWFTTNIGIGCKPCSSICASCTGPSIFRDSCTNCTGVWLNDKCKSDCDKKKSYSVSNGICQLCNEVCDGGCIGPQITDCKKCRHRKIYLNKIKVQFFYCNESCPADQNIVELEEGTGHYLCVSEWASRARVEKLKRTKVTIGTVLAMLLLVILVIVLIVIFLRRKSIKERMEADIKARFSNLTEPSSKDKDALLRPANMGRLSIISSNDLIFEDQTRPLGFGAFGYVYKGKWRVPKEENTLLRKSAAEFYLPVAIKVIKTIGNEENEAIMQEAKIMASVSHLHCLRFIGVCLSSEKPCLVTAYVKEGSLDKYLVRNQSKITSLIMLSWAEQIADGMLYLSSRGIIHRDLAARNVLVSRPEFVQITDFGLAKILEKTNDTEIVIKSGKVPIRWLSIETLTEGRYSHETDVWAYGVTLWEIFTFGKIPYEDQDTTDISEYVLKGGRLTQPEVCSLDVYIVMVNCWLESPNLRPEFSTLMSNFAGYCKNPGRYLSIEGDPYEIPSPTNIEMANMNNNQYSAENIPSEYTGPNTAETTLPLLYDRYRHSADKVACASTRDLPGEHHPNNKTSSHPDNSSHNISGIVSTSTSTEKDPLPTRSTKSLNPFKKLIEPRHSSNQRNTLKPGINTASAGSPIQSPNHMNDYDDPRYVAESSEKQVKLRHAVNSSGPSASDSIRHPLLSQTPRFHSNNPITSSSKSPISSVETPGKCDEPDGYLEPVPCSSPNNQSPFGTGGTDGYLEPVRNTSDEYLNPSQSNTPRTSAAKSVIKTNNNRLPSNSSSNQYQNTLYTEPISNDIRDIDDDERSPSNLYFPQNLVEEEYLEPKLNLNTKK